jgi:protein-S-isoprenylcysteine O-methyltransferase Ste14
VLAIYLTCAFLLLGAAWIVFRIIVRRDYLSRGRLSLLSTTLESLIWGPFFCFPYIYNPPSWPAFWLPDRDIHPLIRYTGVALIIIGLALMLIAMASLGFRRSFGQEVNRLKQTALYGLTRNPQIVGSWPLILGVAIRWPSWYALGWMVIFAAMAHMMVLTEEEHLQDVFGEVYRRYCERVPRYI